MSASPNPPRLVERFFEWFCHQAHQEGLEGDLYEMFERNVKKHGTKRAKIRYIRDVITLIRSSVMKPVRINSKFTTMDVYKNYLLTALRMGWKRKGFSFINLMGLTLGITSVIFIALFISDELKYDKHISGYENKYRIYNIYHNSTGKISNIALVPPMFGPEFKNNFPQVEKAGRIFLDYGGSVFRVGNQLYSEENGFFAEEEALDILDIQLIHGTKESLKDPNTMLLSESLFQKFFGDEPFSEQTVSIGDDLSFKVGGIYADLPQQTHIRPDYFYSFKYLQNVVPEERMKSWRWQQFYTYVELAPDTRMTALGERVRELIEITARPQMEEISSYYEPVFQPLADIHLHSDNMGWDIAETGSYQSVIFLFLSAVIILFIACLNFINLTSAQALKRAKEVVVRKFIGANRSQLITQYVLESSLYTVISGALSVVLVVVLLPFFNQLVGKDYVLSELFQPVHVGLLFLFVILLGIISGIYPSLLITSVKPLDAVHGNTTVKSAGGGFKLELRQVVVGLQYVLSIGLILISLIMKKQYDYLRNTDMGFNKENLLVFPLTNTMKNDLEQTKRRFSAHNNIKSATACYGVPGGMIAGDAVTIPGSEEKNQTINAFMVDEDYIPTLGIELVAGRNFSKGMPSDEIRSFVINETAVKNFGFSTPEQAIGKELHWDVWDDADTLKKGRVIGVIKDFNYKSLHTTVESSVLQIDRRNYSYLVLRIGSGDFNNTIAFLEEQYLSMTPNKVFEFEFVDRSFQKFYETEQRLSRLFSIFTLLAIFTASIGLFGLVSYSIVSRGKEIGIRKVLGAATVQLFYLLVRRYFILLGISMVIAFPLAYYAVSGWLDNFAYRIDINPGTFLLVMVVTMVMTFLTVGYQAFRGASVNPSDKLRAE